EQDRAAIDLLLRHLAHVRADQVILISTIDVYPVTRGVDESFDCHGRLNHAYGVNRLYVEEVLRERYPDIMIVRLPGVFGPGLKKNVIYDLLHDNCLDAISPNGIFQYYNVAKLWDDLENIQKYRLPLVNLVTEPLATSVILRTYFPGINVGAKARETEPYDVRSLHAEILGGRNGYRFGATQVLSQLGSFIEEVRKDSQA
ncbi:MAG: pyridine nucleotide transhydrogenase, partial [Acidobacteriota bacterium]|nr:pyridine nucleotide transhydrogenase [Acidobacteriota bacterium]